MAMCHEPQITKFRALTEIYQGVASVLVEPCGQAEAFLPHRRVGPLEAELIRLEEARCHRAWRL